MADVCEKLSENMEDYLEVIYALSKETGAARVGEIAEKMSVKSPSVNAALKALADRGLVIHEKYGCPSLTKEGVRLAAAVQEKHDVLFRFLTEFLMIAPQTAEHEACSLEHALSTKTFIRFSKFLKFLEISGGKNSKQALLRSFEAYLKDEKAISYP